MKGEIFFAIFRKRASIAAMIARLSEENILWIRDWCNFLLVKSEETQND